MDAARIFDELMTLPPAERRLVCLRALETVAEPTPAELADIEEAQYQEVLRRLKDIEEGREQLVEWETVHADLRAKIARHGT